MNKICSLKFWKQCIAAENIWERELVRRKSLLLLQEFSFDFRQIKIRFSNIVSWLIPIIFSTRYCLDEFQRTHFKRGKRKHRNTSFISCFPGIKFPTCHFLCCLYMHVRVFHPKRYSSDMLYLLVLLSQTRLLHLSTHSQYFRAAYEIPCNKCDFCGPLSSSSCHNSLAASPSPAICYWQLLSTWLVFIIHLHGPGQPLISPESIEL